MLLSGSKNAEAGAMHDDRRLPALTGLRFFAAMTVLISHFAHRGIILVPAGIVAFVDGGRTAVALFFVLSGFILTYNYSQLSGRADRRAFYVNRVARIYPVVVLSLFLGAIGVAYVVLADDRARLLDWYALKEPSPVALAASFLSQLTVTTGWFPTARINQPWNSPAWSIACEMFFYLLFPLLIVWLRRLGRVGLSILVTGAFACQVLLVIAVRLVAPEGQRGFLVSQFPVTHLFDFIVGMVAALLFLRGGREWLMVGHRRIILLACSIVVIATLSATVPVRPAYLLLTPFFASLILGLAVPPRKGRSWLATGWVLLLGEASFSLYLIHVPLMNLMSLAGAPAWFGWVWVMLTIGASILVFAYFESPARRATKRSLSAVLGRRAPHRTPA
ncbi:acyltransferase family protein [Clavibacter zhangzhiyongii]|uniref:acyltransferase family protein n=1 Tax=Clavibacter zhangzhiyongii TaxID=2768071 RepID=UPI0039DFDF49